MFEVHTLGVSGANCKVSMLKVVAWMASHRRLCPSTERLDYISIVTLPWQTEVL